jgi:hypothetical protein
MTLFWLLCACLFLGLLAFHPRVQAALTDTWLHWFGVRVPIRPATAPPRREPSHRPDPRRGPPGHSGPWSGQ